MAVTETLSDFIVRTSYADIPASVIGLAKKSFLDTLGIAFGGITELPPQLLLRYVRELGGPPIASVVATDIKTNAQNAALVNGTAADVLGWSDVSVVQMTHPSVSICPALWALGQQHRSSGKDILQAQIIGTEITNKISAGVRPDFQIAGWHPLAVFNTFGVTAAAGKLLGLGEMQMRNAFGIAGAEASGIRAALGTMCKAYGAGRSARDGIACAELANLGFTGPVDVFEVKDGFLQTFGNGRDGREILENLGDPFEFVEPGIAFKKFPSCTRTHTAIQGVIELLEEYGFSYDEVDRVKCLVTPAVGDVLTFHTPKTKLEAKYSMEFCVASVLRDGDVDAATFSDEKVRDGELTQLMTRVEMEVWAEYARSGYNPPDAPYGCFTTIKLKSGRELSKRVDNVPWGKEHPPTWEDLVNKFRSNGQKVLPDTLLDQSIEMISNLEHMNDISELLEIVSGRVEQGANPQMQPESLPAK